MRGHRLAWLPALGTRIFGQDGRSHARWVAGALFVLALVVYRMVTIPATVNRLDNEWYVPTSLSLIEEGNAELSEFMEIKGFRRSYRIHRLDDQVYNFYPIGTSLVILPLVAVGQEIYRDVPHPKKSRLLADLIADLLAATSVALFFLVALDLGVSGGVALLGAFLFAFATQHFSIHAGGLWSHNTTSFLFLIGAWCSLRPSSRLGWVAGLAAALALLSRPTAVLWVGLMGAYLCWQNRRQLLGYVSMMLGAGVLFALWNHSIYGHWLPPYYQQKTLSFGHFWEALALHLVSPNRGLLVFTPIFLLSLVGGFLVLRQRKEHSPFYLLALSFMTVQWLFIATFEKWAGGWSYGARLVVESVPAWSLLLLPCLGAVFQLRQWRRALAVAVVGLLTSASFFVQYRGVTDETVYTWNKKPHRVGRHSHRMWDWSDMQIFRDSEYRQKK